MRHVYNIRPCGGLLEGRNIMQHIRKIRLEHDGKGLVREPINPMGLVVKRVKQVSNYRPLTFKM